MVIHCLVLIIPGRNGYVANNHGDRCWSQIPGVTGPLPNGILMALPKLLTKRGDPPRKERIVSPTYQYAGAICEFQGG